MGEPPGRMPPPAELVNSFEFELMAKRKLDSATYAEIAGGQRRAMDRITFNPRMMVNTSGLDLTTPMFGDNLFAPILIGPIADQKRYHPEGELAMLRGAAAATTPLVIPDHPAFLSIRSRRKPKASSGAKSIQGMTFPPRVHARPKPPERAARPSSLRLVSRTAWAGLPKPFSRFRTGKRLTRSVRRSRFLWS